ncbi:hypothetical protein MKW98_026171 [Papaver atlanticum]|uniref:Uncharacterized protein n=1 Tax=Papaver atlanticum TaxID=357466 RepID=A0AAD4TKJ1_9MAGN|nr:hypothetical protein MKW98_026171 [Papaver atlanticum]
MVAVEDLVRFEFDIYSKERHLHRILGTYGSRRGALISNSEYRILVLLQGNDMEETEDVKDLKPLSDRVLIKVEEAEKGLLVDYF